MLRLITDERIEEALSFCSLDPIGARIGAYLEAYETKMSFAMFWEQIRDEKITATVGKVDGDMTVFASENADLAELFEFIGIIGFNTLYSHAGLLEKFGFEFKRGDILLLKSSPKEVNNIVFDVEPRELYRLMSSVSSVDTEIGDYLPWLSDYTFRQRRDKLRSVGVFKGDKLISCALTSAETEKSAVISGVSTDVNYRNQGLAKKCVNAVSAALKDIGKENIFVMTKNSDLTKYYEKLGFVKEGEWGLCTFSQKG